MMKKLRTISVLAAVFAVPTVAMAGVHFVPSAPGMTPDPNNPGVWKTAPMSNGQQLVVNWAVHTKFAATHWAGVRFRSHVLDAGEVSLSGIVIYPGLLGQQTIPGPAGSTTGINATWWHAQATQSGINVLPSQSFAFGQWTITVGNTDPANNSDVDMTAHASSIFHLGSQVSETITIFPSWYIWATPNFEPTISEPFPQDPPHPDAGLGTWIEFGMTMAHHITPGMASGFYSVPIGGAGLGIEHVIPAPGVGLLMLAGGYGALGARRRAGRRRLA
ncbi:MAG: hypothetical protein ACYSUR_16335 [Planctomycetota bacterium]|jgi:hypothetical protein